MVSLREPLRQPSLLIYQLMIVAAVNYHRRRLLPISPIISPINAISPTACIEGENAPGYANSRDGGFLVIFAGRWLAPPAKPNALRVSQFSKPHPAAVIGNIRNPYIGHQLKPLISRPIAPISRPSSPVPLQSDHLSMRRLNCLPPQWCILAVPFGHVRHKASGGSKSCSGDCHCHFPH
jgi:hypothetical protein